MNRQHIARSVGAPNGGRKVLHGVGLTEDILNEIVREIELSWQQVKPVAEQFRGKDHTETAFNIWLFIRQNIRYQLDPFGLQYIKTPARTLSDGFADCKGYSILTASILKALNIPNASRFVSYKDDNPTVTHVYTVAKDEEGKEIKIDACLPQFNYEKPYSHKIDKMTKIVRLSGIGELETTPMNIIPGETSEAELDLQLLRERLELEKQLAVEQGISGIGSTLDRSYDYNLDMVNAALAEISGNEVVGLRFFKKITSGVKKFFNKTKVGKFVKKVTSPIRKVVKVAAKVVSYPARLAAKGILELTLPKAAPFFLYLFITDKYKLAKMPPKVKAKRKKAERIAKFITGTIGMRESHLMGILRNGIMKQTRKTPEQLIESMMKAGVSGVGIGALPIAAIASAVPAIIEVIKKIFSVFKKKSPEEVTASDAPSESDFAVPKSGKTDWGDVIKTGADVIKQISPVDRTPAQKITVTKQGGGANPDNNPVPDSEDVMQDFSEEQPVQKAGSNTMLWVGLAIGGGFLLMNSKKK